MGPIFISVIIYKLKYLLMAINDALKFNDDVAVDFTANNLTRCCLRR